MGWFQKCAVWVPRWQSLYTQVYSGKAWKGFLKFRITIGFYNYRKEENCESIFIFPFIVVKFQILLVHFKALFQTSLNLAVSHAALH